MAKKVLHQKQHSNNLIGQKIAQDQKLKLWEFRNPNKQKENSYVHHQPQMAS